MINKNKRILGISLTIFTLLLVLNISTTQALVQTANMMELPDSFIASVNPDFFEIGMSYNDSICLEITIMTPIITLYAVGDRMNYTLIDVQPHEYIFDEVIYTPDGPIHTEENYTVPRSELRLPLFMTTTNKSLIQELFSANSNWNYTYEENFHIFRQQAYDYPDLGDTSYFEYIYDGFSGWMVSLYQIRTAANQTILSEAGMVAVATALPPTTVESTETSAESTSNLSSISQDSTTTTFPKISSFLGIVEILGVIGFVLVIYRRKR
ncbi:hypothetical protein CEE45_10915 [Candidatus Heimdallarchaeota archaeon B3_Heim]|nr:MAG: hypothetical protein CEE45_10915 [Candidatus Heimdallarchaeota archaeon B3_Heim]